MVKLAKGKIKGGMCPLEKNNRPIPKSPFPKSNDNDGWIECGLPWATYDSEEMCFADDCTETSLKMNKPGVLVETEKGIFLIGHMNPHSGLCDCCSMFKGETIIKRYKVVWSEGDT